MLRASACRPLLCRYITIILKKSTFGSSNTSFSPVSSRVVTAHVKAPMKTRNAEEDRSYCPTPTTMALSHARALCFRTRAFGGLKVSILCWSTDFVNLLFEEIRLNKTQKKKRVLQTTLLESYRGCGAYCDKKWVRMQQKSSHSVLYKETTQANAHRRASLNYDFRSHTRTKFSSAEKRSFCDCYGFPLYLRYTFAWMTTF